MTFAACWDLLAPLRSWLSAEERDRAHQFELEDLRERFVLSHGFLRGVLAGYLGVGPSQISIAQDPHGKPRVDDNEGVAFSLAHCDSHAAVAIASNAFVGVDVEQHRPWLNRREIAGRFFAREELELLSGLSQPEADLRFREIWTCKEAFVKAIGLGLSYSLDRFAVGAPGKGIFCLTRVEAEYGRPQAWSLLVRALEPDCSIAVAIRAPEPLSLRFWGYPPDAD